MNWTSSIEESGTSGGRRSKCKNKKRPKILFLAGVVFFLLASLQLSPQEMKKRENLDKEKAHHKDI